MADVMGHLAVQRRDEPPGLEVVDRIEQQRYAIHTPEPVATRETATDAFRFPVSRAIQFETAEFSLPTVVGAFVRNPAGGMVAEVEHPGSVELPAGAYCLELSTQIKTYVAFEAAVEVVSDADGATISFDEETTVRLGVRSRHDHPAGTVTTAGDPSDVMAAIETFGSALKTTDPERAYPTLRGHPPAVELGEALSVPDGLDAPATGITLELPLDLETLYVAAPLAYYLGASLEAAPAPRLVTDRGFEYDLDGPAGFETTVGDTLQQLFFLDCVTRTEGLYQVPLDERERIEPLVDIDFAECYDRPLAEQVARYLEVPFGVVEDPLPEWPLATHVAPAPETVEQLPFVVDDLAVIRSTGSSASASASQPSTTPTLAREEVLTRSAGPQVTRSAGPEATTVDSFVRPGETDAVEQAWIGEDIPIGASKLTAEAFRNRLDREVTTGDIEIAIVLNDERMAAERDVVDRVYGDRERLPFDVSVHSDTTVAELRALLGHQRGFLHYIGHTEADGFECADGKLDAASLDEVGIDAFLLNACSSYAQGLALIEAGAIGGIVTLTDIINDEGVKMGGTVARLLNAGFPLRASLTIAREESIQGGQYIVVGDGGMAVTQAESRTPTLLGIRSDGQFTVQISTFCTDSADIGTMVRPHLDRMNSYHLASNTVEEQSISRDDLATLLDQEEVPIQTADGLRWSSNVDLDEV